MKNKIKENIENPEQLEKIYRADKKGFEKAFYEIYSEIAEFKISDFWKVRLEHDRLNDYSLQPQKAELGYLMISCLIAGFLIEIPKLFDINPEATSYYEKNAGLIFLLGVSIYTFLTKAQINIKQVVIAVLVFGFSAVYINFLPSDPGSDSINLAYLHLPLMIWCLYGLIFIDFDLKNKNKRIDYIKHNGDLAVILAILLIAGAILSGVTIGLFSAIDIKIEQLYMDYVGLIGLVSAPVVATFVIRNYPLVANKIAPIVANIFSPLVLITLIVYLASIFITGKNPYNDRDFLIVFNLMLLGVMGIIVFAVSETSVNKRQRFNEMTLFVLSIITLIIDLVALSAILYRLGEFGFTPNRTAALGANLLIFGNLVLIMIDLYRVNFRNKEIKQVEMTIANYLPVYALWTIFVVFGFPVIFGLK